MNTEQLCYSGQSTQALFSVPHNEKDYNKLVNLLFIYLEFQFICYEFKVHPPIVNLLTHRLLSQIAYSPLVPIIHCWENKQAGSFSGVGLFYKD